MQSNLYAVSKSVYTGVEVLNMRKGEAAAEDKVGHMSSKFVETFVCVSVEGPGFKIRVLQKFVTINFPSA